MKIKHDDNNHIKTLIAQAIKNSDKSYFWENYSKQAIAVMRYLKIMGYKITPMEPTKEMLAKGIEAVKLGKTQPNDLAKEIYCAMIKAYEE